MNSVDRLRNSPRLYYKSCVATRKENLQFDVGNKGLSVTAHCVASVPRMCVFYKRFSAANLLLMPVHVTTGANHLELPSLIQALGVSPMKSYL